MEGPDAVDFESVLDIALTIKAREESGTGTFTLTPEPDQVDETDETIEVTGRSSLPVTPTTVVLADDDEASDRIVLSADPARMSEGDGPTQVTVSAQLNRGARSVRTTVKVEVTGAAGPGAVGFDPVLQFDIVIPAGDLAGTATFTVVPDENLVDEPDETLAVSGDSDLDVEGTTVLLADDDEMSDRIALSADPERVSEGDGPTRVAVTARLNRSARPGGDAGGGVGGGHGGSGRREIRSGAGRRHGVRPLRSPHPVHEPASRPPRGGVEAGSVRVRADQAVGIDLAVNHGFVQGPDILVGEFQPAQDLRQVVGDHDVGTPDQPIASRPCAVVKSMAMLRLLRESWSQKKLGYSASKPPSNAR